MADDSLELTVGDNSLELEVNPPYVGSAFSPEVDIEETTSTITVTITDARGEHSYSVPNTESAIADAEAATAAATSAASAATSAVSAAGTATTAANNAASAAASAASDASDAADLAEEKAGVAVQAASDANSAAEVASAKATLANNAASAANSAASAAGNAASAATSAADYADIATRDASAAADAANSAADSANAAAAAAESATETVDEAVASANAAASYANEKGGAASNAANAANSAASSATSAASAANSAASAASTAATNADSKASAANTAAGAANTAATAATSAATAANTSAEAANTAAEYASEFTEAYLPMVTAGVSESLLATDVTVDTFAQRVSDHDGGVRIESLRGNTVRWNQLFPAKTFTYSGDGFTITSNGDYKFVITVTAASATNTNSSNVTSINTNIIAGHKYCLKCGDDTIRVTLKANGAGGTFIGVINSSFTFSNISVVFTDLPMGTYEVNTQIYDLTTMFGAGNEPATVAEFERQYPEDYYPYDAGSLLSVNVEGIESAGVTREIPASTLFTDGILRSAGSVYDERTPTMDVKRITETTINVEATGVTVTTDNAPNNAGLYSNVISFNNSEWVAQGLSTFLYGDTSHVALNIDSVLGITNNVTNFANATKPGIGIYESLKRIYYRSTSALTVEQFKTFFSGNNAVIISELATPIETTIDPPLNLAYPTEQGGTESIVIPTGEQSAAPTMAIVYAYDADGVRDLSQAIIATIEGNTASTNYAIGGYFVHAGKLYKATSAIATGETINPGTNCTQTTVMAELLVLTA